MGKLIRPSKIPKIIREERRISMGKDLRKKINVNGEDLVNKFLFKGETLNKKLAKNAPARAEFAKAKEAQKQQEKEKNKEEKSSFISRFFKKDSEVEEGFVLLYNRDGEEFICQEIDASQLLDEHYVPFERNVRGQELLHRKFFCTPLYVSDNGDIMKVQKAFELFSEDADDESAYVVLETNREYYVVAFKVKRIF